MEKKLSYGGGGVLLWFLQRITGGILLVLLLLHTWIVHYAVSDHGLNFEVVAQRVATPFWKTIDVVFLITAVFHGLNGVWMIASDYIQKEWLRVAVVSALITLGAVLMVLGSLTIIPFRA